MGAEFKDSKTALVADVDCTAGGQSLCNEVGVRGYPTIKYGDPNNLEDYKGGRDFDALKKFAEENLEKDFKEFVEGLQKSYTEANEKKDKDVEAIKNSGLGLMKAVAAHSKAAKAEL